MSPALAAALAIVRGWTRFYTAHMDSLARDRRRAEIESDLWELHEDARRRGASPTAIAIHMLLRFALGAVDDVAWRAEQTMLLPRIVKQALWAGAVASIAFVWWLAASLQVVAPPPQGEGINVLRLLYPMRPVISVPSPPAPPIEFVEFAHYRASPPPPPPPPPPR
jgi:hypothetical protein